MPRRLASSTSSCAEARTWRDRARRAVERVEPHGLDRIDHRDLGRIGPLERRHDVAHRGRGRRAAPARRPGPAARRAAAPGRPPPRRRCRRRPRAGAASAAATCSSSVDLPMPGSPPISSAEPTHQPAAADAVEFGDAALVARRLRRRAGRGRRTRAGGPCRRAPARRRRGPGAGAASSTMVFHSPQDSQRPLHLFVTAPHDWQTKRLQRLRAMAQSFRTCIRIGPSARPWMNWST